MFEKSLFFVIVMEEEVMAVEVGISSLRATNASLNFVADNNNLLSPTKVEV